MRRFNKSLVSLGLCTAMTIGALGGLSGQMFKPTEVLADNAVADEEVQLSDLVIKFLGVPEYEPNRYTKSNGGKWAPEELEKGLKIKAEMKLGEGNPEGMMAPLKHSLADITAFMTADQATGKIEIKYNGMTLKMEQGKKTAELNDGKSTKTYTMNDAVTPYFELIEGETDENGNPYYACYLPVKFTAEVLGGNVVWNEQMSRLEMAFAFYYSDAAVTPVENSSSNYTTSKMEGGGIEYKTLLGRTTISASQDADAVAKNVAEMIKGFSNVVDPVYQNADGGWGKTGKQYDLLNDTFKALCPSLYSTIDNGSTHGHIKSLARMIRLSKEQPALFASYANEIKAIERGFWKGVKWIMDAQKDVGTGGGGWSQYYPYGVGYFKNITFNDNAMQVVMEVVYALVYDDGLISSVLNEDFQWAREALANATSADATEFGITKAKMQTIWDKALKYVIEAQVEIGGVTTGWSQQYDPETGAPTTGRAYELPSVSPGESLKVVTVLMNIKSPTPEIQNAIRSYVAWIQECGMTGYKQYEVKDRTRELAKDRFLVKDGTTSKLFGRFYGLDLTGEYYGLDKKDAPTDSKYYEIFAGRDGVAQFTMNNGMSERRSGYSYVREKSDTDAAGELVKWEAALIK